MSGREHSAADLIIPYHQLFSMNSSKAELIDLTTIEAVECPCGLARRAFKNQGFFPGTVHLTDIHRDAKSHFHQEHTEIYVILSCESDARIELDGVCHPVKPLTAVLIPPGVRHRAIGQMQVLIICNPKFDPEDEQL